MKSVVKRIIGKVRWLVKTRILAIPLRLHDRVLSTHGCDVSSLYNLLPTNALSTFKMNTDLIPLANRFRNHEFNVLGSGWVRNVRDAASDQWESQLNGANRAKAQRIWKMIPASYTPIDWQLDFKSGHRWPESTWYADISRAYKAGVDIKVPWELARMQHLPLLALADPKFSSECRDQILDFIATNPPRYGVNWQCSMEVGIRAVNWLVTHDLFIASGVRFDDEFEHIFARSIYAHGRHIANNLETATLPAFLANHYLADIVGLLFIAAALPRSSQTDRWLAFCVQELIEAVWVQFGDDGGNYEASTCYHAFSGEMIVYATALVLGLSDDKRTALRAFEGQRITLGGSGTPLHAPPFQLHSTDGHVVFPDWFVTRVQGMGDFVAGITKDNGEIPQVGDNDSGRLLVLTPSSNELDRRYLVSACNALFGQPPIDGFEADYAVAAALAGGRTLAPSQTSHASFRAYPAFGLFVYRHEQAYIAVRCGHNGQNGNGGHAHNDQLSFEFALGSQNIIVDPGTYVYTPHPDERDRFRSTAMHNVMMPPGIEQNRWPSRVFGLFMLKDQAHARVLTATESEFVGQHEGYGFVATRTMKLSSRSLQVVDSGGTGERQVWFHFAPGVIPTVSDNGLALTAKGQRLCRLEGEGVWSSQNSYYSAGYGLIQDAMCACLVSDKPGIRWALTW